MDLPSLTNVRAKLATETGLAEVITIRQHGRPLVSVINAGIIPHPSTGDDVVCFVSRGQAARLGHLRRSPEISMAVRRGWDWDGIDGTAELAGPNDPHPTIPADKIASLIRTIYQAAGGVHDDYEEFDRVMAEDQRTAVLITPTKVYGNSPN